MPIDWFDGVSLTAEAALAAASGDYGLFDVGRFDEMTFGPDVIWADVSGDVRSISTRRTFSREVQGWQPGTATFVLGNRHRHYSPSNLDPASPFVVGGVSQIRPLRPMRWAATYAGVTYYGYTGYSTAWEETFLPGHSDAYVTVPCEDELAMLGVFDGVEQPAVGGGETSGRRVHRVLDSVGYTGARSIELGQVTLQATTLAANASAELKLTSDSEGGALWVEADGSVVFEQQLALIDNDRSITIQATFGDGSGPELPCANIAVDFNGELVRNIVSYARVGGTPQLVSDSASQQIYPNRRESRTDLLCATDSQALALAEFYLERFKEPEQRVTQITIKPRSDPARLFPQVLGRRVRDLIRVVVRPLGGGEIVRDCHIAGISHQISKDDWVTTFDLWSASVYQTYATSKFDIGRFDEMKFFFGSGA